MHRAASFRTMSDHFISDEISVLKLSEAGFIYTGKGSVIKCEGCGQEILMEQLRQDGHVTDPNEAKFHNDNCVFVRCKTNPLSTAMQGMFSRPNEESFSLEHVTGGSPQIIPQQLIGNATSLLTSRILKDQFVYDDCEDTEPDVERIYSRNEDKRKQCERNPDHFGCSPINNVTLDHLPGPARHQYVVQLLQTFSLLTVRIIVKLTNSGRSGLSEYKVATGFVSLSDSDPNQKITTASEGDGINGLRTTNDTSKDKLNNNKDTLIRIETSKHLVSQDQDPGTVTVEFFYDDPYRGHVKTADVISIQNRHKNGEYRSFLNCRPSDVTLVQKIANVQQQLVELVANIPDQIKEFLSKKVFIIHHLHGREKYLSHGDCVLVKYKLVTDEENKKMKLHKLSTTDCVSENVSDTYKMLMYTADTCPGTAGAPVITFNKRSPDGQFMFDVWMHNGLNKQHELGCTVLKFCNTDELATEKVPSYEILTDGQQETISTTPLNGTSEQRSSPLPLPSYPAYSTKQKRSDSYIGWCHNDVHEPEYLSKAGFFYAGYSDCVRCYQCGLGLRSWKPGDNVLDEHRKYRADCPFLQNLLNCGTHHYLSKIV